MGRCLRCGKDSPTVARMLGCCAGCIREHYGQLESHVSRSRSAVRDLFKLPGVPPRDNRGSRCNFCVNECVIPEGRRGYCGVRINVNGRVIGGTAWANVSWYYDALPTNCVADWVCPEGAGAGHSRFPHTCDAEREFYNLAVFYRACSFDCLFCQNWHFRKAATALGPRGVSRVPPADLADRGEAVGSGAEVGMGGTADAPITRHAGITPAALASAVGKTTSCICYFGGDPAPQMIHSILTSRRAMRRKNGAILRVCWETNGSSNPDLLRLAVDIALESGGCIKFDLKAWDENLHKALCGVTNSRTLANFRETAEYALRRRPDPPPVVASTLLVPGYVDEREVHNIARHVADIDRDIPYSLLAFYPSYCMDDLPTTSVSHASRCMEAAKGAGLRYVRLGNRHLLGPDYG